MRNKSGGDVSMYNKMDRRDFLLYIEAGIDELIHSEIKENNNPFIDGSFLSTFVGTIDWDNHREVGYIKVDDGILNVGGGFGLMVTSIDGTENYGTLPVGGHSIYASVMPSIKSVSLEGNTLIFSGIGKSKKGCKVMIKAITGSTSKDMAISTMYKAKLIEIVLRLSDGQRAGILKQTIDNNSNTK